jgi:carbon monoxide dehydrogenase subunit G
MATIIKEILIDARPDDVWDAVRDFGQVHKRLVPGFVTECHLDGDTRVVTFFNGLKAREPLVGVDEKARRLAYAAVGGRATHYNASVQVFAEGERRTRFVWIIDLLPNELAEPIGAMVEQGANIIKRTLERAAANAAG